MTVFTRMHAAKLDMWEPVKTSSLPSEISKCGVSDFESFESIAELAMSAADRSRDRIVPNPIDSADDELLFEFQSATSSLIINYHLLDELDLG